MFENGFLTRPWADFFYQLVAASIVLGGANDPGKIVVLGPNGRVVTIDTDVSPPFFYMISIRRPVTPLAFVELLLGPHQITWRRTGAPDTASFWSPERFQVSYWDGLSEMSSSGMMCDYHTATLYVDRGSKRVQFTVDAASPTVIEVDNNVVIEEQKWKGDGQTINYTIPVPAGTPGTLEFEHGVLMNFTPAAPSAPGVSGTVPLAKITPSGSDGSLTFNNGYVTAFTAPT